MDPSGTMWGRRRRMCGRRPSSFRPRLDFLGRMLDPRSRLNRGNRARAANPTVSELPFRFNNLPAELKLMILETMLVVPGGIPNPWLKDESDKPLKPWAKSLRPNILATNKALYEMGRKILYSYNTFIVAASRSCRCGQCFEEINLFFTEPHGKWDTTGRYTTLRNQLIRKIIIQSCCLDSDDYAARGIARPLVQYSDRLAILRYEDISQSMHVLRLFEHMDMNLFDLTITIDQDIPGIVEFMEMETRARTLSPPVSSHTAYPGKKVAFVSEAEVQERKIWWENKRAIWKPTPGWSAIFSSFLKIRKLNIRGIDYYGKEQLGQYGERVDKSQRVVSSLGNQINNWLDAAQIKISSGCTSGPFIERRLKRDGTIIPYEEWIETNVPQEESQRPKIEKEKETNLVPALAVRKTVALEESPGDDGPDLENDDIDPEDPNLFEGFQDDEHGDCDCMSLWPINDPKWDQYITWSREMDRQ